MQPEVNFSKWEVGLRWPLRCANQRAPQLNRFTSTSIHSSGSRQHFGYLDEWELFATRIHLGIRGCFSSYVRDLMVLALSSSNHTIAVCSTEYTSETRHIHRNRSYGTVFHVSLLNIRLLCSWAI